MIWILLRREYGASVAIDDKYDGLQRLVQMGKEKGYVLYDEVSEVLPGDLPAGSELDEVLAGLDVAGRCLQVHAKQPSGHHRQSQNARITLVDKREACG